MSEVHRYKVVKMLSEDGNSISYAPHGPDVVLADNFDRVTAEHDALQHRLTAADERNDNRDSEIFAQVQSALRRSFSLGQIYWQQADSDSTCQQNKSDQTMEVQEQHILNVLKSLGVALKPAECCTVSAEDRALLATGDYTPEELFGVGGKPSCPKCAQ